MIELTQKASPVESVKFMAFSSTFEINGVNRENTSD